MPRERYNCDQCGESVPLYSAHKKCDKEKSLYDKVFSQSQNRWMWQCKVCLKVDRDYKKHSCSTIKTSLDTHKLCDQEAETLTKRSTNDAFNSDIASEIKNRNHHSRHQNRLELGAIDENSHGDDGEREAS